MTSRTRLLVLLVSTPVLAFAVVGGVLGQASAKDSTYPHLRVFEDVISLIVNNYVEAADPEKVMDGAMRGLAEALDPDSAYVEAKDVREIESGRPPAEGSVGLELTRQYYLRVIATRDQSPAARAGLQSGDYVRAIDGKPTREMSVLDGARLLRGAVGTKATLLVIRGNAAEPHTIELVREKPSAPDVSSRQLGSGIGYVRIAGFGPRTAEQLRAQVSELTRGGASKLIVDVRRTAEGPLDTGLAAARLFVASGTLGIKESRNHPRETIAAAKGDGTVTQPVALLVGDGTAGAAELFASALAGNKRAELIGQPTVGRAAVQKLTKLPDGTGLWLSAARYLTPAGTPLHLKGLEPAVTVEEPDVDFGMTPPPGDPVLDKAIERLKK